VDKWPEAEPFQRMHIDWAYVKEVGNLLVIVDAGSGWIEAFSFKERTSANVIRALRTVFTRFGVPEIIVSDNAQEFVSKEFNFWLNNQGARKTESPPYFPRSNGLAERGVQTVKKAACCLRESHMHKEFGVFLQVLFHHRNSSISRGRSPAETVFNRKLRVPIVSPFQQGQDIWYKTTGVHEPARRGQFVMTRGSNTSWIMSGNGENACDQMVLASNNQIGPTGDNLVERSQSAAVLQPTETTTTAASASALHSAEPEVQAPVTAVAQDYSAMPLQPAAVTDTVRRSTRMTKPVLRYGLLRRRGACESTTRRHQNGRLDHVAGIAIYLDGCGHLDLGGWWAGGGEMAGRIADVVRKKWAEMQKDYVDGFWRRPMAMCGC